MRRFGKLEEGRKFCPSYLGNFHPFSLDFKRGIEFFILQVLLWYINYKVWLSLEVGFLLEVMNCEVMVMALASLSKELHVDASYVDFH